MRTVVALFDRFDQAQRAVQTFVNEQFRREDITFLSRDATGSYTEELNRSDESHSPGGQVGPNERSTAGMGIGAGLSSLGGLLVGLSAITVPGVGPVIAAGPMTAGLSAAGIGTLAGGLLGSLTDMGIPEEHASFYAEGIRRGGTLVVIRVEDHLAERARQLLNRFNPVDIQIHARAWREGGWTHFDQNAPTLSPDQMEFNRANIPLNRDRVTQPEPPVQEFGSGMDEHFSEDVFSKERVHNKVVDMPVTGGTVEEVNAQPAEGQDWANDEAQFHQDFLTRFGQTGHDYSYYQPAYRFGYELGQNPGYRGYTWDQIEPDARREYERRSLKADWDDVKDAVRYALEVMAPR